IANSLKFFSMPVMRSVLAEFKKLSVTVKTKIKAKGEEALSNDLRLPREALNDRINPRGSAPSSFTVAGFHLDHALLNAVRRNTNPANSIMKAIINGEEGPLR